MVLTHMEVADFWTGDGSLCGNLLWMEVFDKNKNLFQKLTFEKSAQKKFLFRS
jgi:hypothetical protein